jgi:hypothetical protein
VLWRFFSTRPRRGASGSVTPRRGTVSPPTQQCAATNGALAGIVGSEPAHLLVDSLGLKLCEAGERLVGKHGTKTRRSRRKLHSAMDTDTGEIVAAALITNDVDDASQVGQCSTKSKGP